jgi:hypothetical protein
MGEKGTSPFCTSSNLGFHPLEPPDKKHRCGMGFSEFWGRMSCERTKSAKSHGPPDMKAAPALPWDNPVGVRVDPPIQDRKKSQRSQVSPGIALHLWISVSNLKKKKKLTYVG